MALTPTPTPTQLGPMIRLKDIQKSYHVGSKSLHVLRGVSLNIEAGEMVAIMGASGSGKSTLLHVLGLLDKHDGGEYRLDGEVVHDLSETESARLRSRKLDPADATQGVFFKNAAGTEVRATRYFTSTGGTLLVLVPATLTGPQTLIVRVKYDGNLRETVYGTILR